MIDRCRENADRAGQKPNLYVQAMQSLDLPRRYQTIIVPSSSFLHLTTLDDARQALQRFHAHLQPGGLLAMSLRIYEPDPAAAEWEINGETVCPADGATVRSWFRCTYDVPYCLQSMEYRYKVVKDGEFIQSETYATLPDLTGYSLTESLDLLNRAGFADVHAHSNFTFEPATAVDTSYVVLGSRAWQQTS